MARLVVSSLVAASVAGGGAAWAQDAAIEEARAHFDNGQALYDKGEFGKAAEAFLAASKAKPFPAFTYNAALAFDQLKDYARAVELFARYLKEEPSTPDKKEVEECSDHFKGFLIEARLADDDDDDSGEAVGVWSTDVSHTKTIACF